VPHPTTAVAERFVPEESATRRHTVPHTTTVVAEHFVPEESADSKVARPPRTATALSKPTLLEVPWHEVATSGGGGVRHRIPRARRSVHSDE